MDAPWDDCKVAYGIDDQEQIWRQYGKRPLQLPAGWSLDETDGSGARLVVVFRVEGVPTSADGKAVKTLLRRIRAICPPGAQS